MAGWRRLVPRPLRLGASALLAEAGSRALAGELAALVRSGEVVVAGPWLGEVGFELLYWAPFLRWFAARFDLPPERLVVLSRGGTEAWYAPAAGRYADVLAQIAPEAFRQLHDERVARFGEQKQTRLVPAEQEIAARAAAALGLSRWTLLHPSRMYRLFNPYWWGHRQDEWVHRHASYRRLEPAEPPPLPARSYTAVKFYFNECFPPTDANRRVVADAVRRLRDDGPVVSLSTGLRLDDHDGCRVDDDQVQALGAVPAMDNLRAQSAVVAGARAFVGTYGGFSYLAPFHGVPSLACYGVASGFSRRHLDLARSAFERIGSGGLLQLHDVSGGAAVVEALAVGARHGRTAQASATGSGDTGRL